MIFSADNLTLALSYVGGMFGLGGVPLVSTEWLYYLRSYGLILAVAVVSATPFVKKIVYRLNENKAAAKAIDILEIPVLIALLVLSTAYLADGSFNPFLYFRF